MAIPVVTQPATPRHIAQGVAIPTLSISATNTPTSYAATPLPAGISVNTSTGAITGTPTTEGLTTTVITATNGSGTSASVSMVWSVAASPVGGGLWSDLELDLDLVSRVVSVPGVATPDSGIVFSVARGDKFDLLVGFTKWGVLKDVKPGSEIIGLQCGFKEFEPEALLQLAGGTPDKEGSADTARFRIPLRLTPANWAILADYESDDGTGVISSTEIELTVGEIPVLYDGTDTETGFSIYGGISSPITKTLTYTGLPTDAGPVDYRMTLGLTVVGRSSQTITLTRDFHLSYSAPDWSISSIVGSDTGTGSTDGTKWVATVENITLAGSATGITVAAEITTSDDTTIAYPYVDISAPLSLTGSGTESDTLTVEASAVMQLWDGDDEMADTMFGYWTPASTYDTIADFIAALETGWETASGASDIQSISVFSYGPSPTVRVYLTGSSVTHIRFAASPTTFTAVVTDITTGTTTTATLTGLIEQLEDPDALPLRVTSLPFKVQVIRDMVPD